MRTSSLFSSPPDGQVPVCIANGIVKYCKLNEYDAKIGDMCPSLIELPKPTIRVYHEKHSFRSYLSPSDSRLKMFWDVWYEQGLKNAFEVILEYEEGGSTASKIIRFLLGVTEYISPIIRKNKAVNMDILSECTSSRNWKTCSVRHIVWHPCTTHVAVALNNDCVQIYSCNTFNMRKLMHYSQRDVTCIAFRPLFKWQIAVGCAAGVYVWNFDTHSMIQSPSFNSALILDHQKYVTSISWNERGKLLATCSVYDRSIFVWNLEMETHIVLTRWGSGYPSFISWSPSSMYLFSNSTQPVFRIWFPDHEWKQQTCNHAPGKVKMGCWSPCGNFLLFSVVSDSSIYLLNVAKFSIVPLIDLGRFELSSSGDIFGGEIANMAWDQKGICLAVMFKETDLIAIFSTEITAETVYLITKCVIKGRTSEEPAGMSFQNEFQGGANLLIIWSSGRYQYFPCLQNPPYHARYMSDKWRLNTIVDEPFVPSM